MLNILVVEDEAPIRDWIVYIISNISQEFNVVASAKNGKEGYELALKLKPHVIISDIKMPIMGGLELIKSIKEVMPEVFVILLTNYEEFSYAKEAIKYKVYEYLIKSEIRQKELGVVLQEIYSNIKKIELNNSKSKIKYENKINRDIAQYSKSIAKAINYIEENYKMYISLDDISKHVYLSNEYFSRLFKEEVGENFSKYLTMYRMNKAENLIKNTDLKISQISLEVGYANAGYFSKTYKKYKGVSPEVDRWE